MMNKVNDKINELKELIAFFRNYNELGLNQFVNDEDTLSFPDEVSEKADNMMNIFNYLSKNIKDNSCLEELFSDDELKFWNWIKEYIEYRRKTSDELLYINELSIDEFKKLFEFILKHHILEYNEIEKFDVYDEEKVKIAKKVMNTFVKMIIDSLFSKKVFESYSNDWFDLSKEKSSYIWSLVNKNKTELRYINLIKKLQN